ncbi:MAG TPA: phytanoyl-CoA dioxygenase family protein [Mycobacteriales bacterium]|nr:phytanoyl-CoA dioxygenase family protein [Mycobacteriales bacterium]
MTSLQMPWFESPLFEAELERSELDPVRKEQVQRFARDGYLIFHLELPEFDQLADSVISTLAPDHDRLGLRLQDAWQYCEAVRKIAVADEVMSLLRDLYRREPIPFQTLNFKRGTEQAAHSDLAHFASMPPRYMAGVWVALEDVSEDLGNGPLFYYPGSHRELPIVEPHNLGVVGTRDARYRAYEQTVGELIEHSSLERLVINAKRGDVLIWSANILHGGLPITDPSTTRQTQVTHVFFEGCRYYNPLYSNPALGHFSWRQVTDIRTGRTVPHVVDGKQVRLPVTTRLRYVAEESLRRNPGGRRALEAIKRRVRSA